MTGAEEDLAAAQTLLTHAHLRFALFAAHLAVEKALKAHVIRQTHTMPPKIHNLIRLARIAQIQLDPQREQALRELLAYQLAGRYQDAVTAPIDPTTARSDLNTVRELVQWLKNLL